MKLFRLQAAAGITSLIAAGGLLAFALPSRWQPVHEDPTGTYYLDRNEPSAPGLVHTRTVVLDYRNRNARNERSAVMAVRFDCLYDHASVLAARTHEGPAGRGTRVRDQHDDELRALAWSPGIVEAMRTVCGQALADLDGQPVLPITLRGFDFDRFRQCDLGDGHARLLDRLVTRVRPARKHERVWTYTVVGRIDGATVPNFPVKSIEVGVCDGQGGRACTWGDYAALVLDGPLDMVRAILNRNYRIDFTEGRRSERTGAASRPLLVMGDNSWESKLVCDPGEAR